LNFTPRLKEIAWLRSRAVIRALTDASDGAARAVELLTRERGLGAEIRLDALLVRGRARPGLEDVRHALFDGEDFELVFAAPRMDRGVVERFHKRFTLPLSEIGRVSARKGIRFTWRGGRVRFRGRPYAHF
jgi:thiamine monophosphate kinase